MTISALYHNSRYSALNLNVDSESIDKTPKSPPIPSDGGGGGGDGDGDGSETLVINANLAMFIVGVIMAVSILIIKKRRNFIRK
jgi:hypothetical protein